VTASARRKSRRMNPIRPRPASNVNHTRNRSNTSDVEHRAHRRP
jgi:hypothetical protein